MKSNNGIVNVLIEDDNEILGNGQGHVMYRQYLPTIKYVKLLKEFGIRGTFFVDMAHLLFLKENKDFKDFELQSKIIEKLLKFLIESEMDVQLHLHSQWIGAEIKNDFVFVTNKWNIGQLDHHEQSRLIERSHILMESILNTVVDGNRVKAFKAGSWGIQPFDNLQAEFKKRGINIAMGPIKGLKVPSLNMDYSKMESAYLPYFCDKDDVSKIGDEDGMVIVPMTPTHLNWMELTRYLIHMKIEGFKKNFDSHLDDPISSYPSAVKELNPLKNKDKLSWSSKPFKTHLKINAQPFWYLKSTFKKSYSEITALDSDYKLLVIETHTKDFKNNFGDIRKFFKHINEEYPNLNFITISDLHRDILDGKLNPLKRKL